MKWVFIKMKIYKKNVIIFLFVLVSLFYSSMQPAYTQNAKPKNIPTPAVQEAIEISIPILEDRKKKIEASTTLDNEVKTKVIELYDQAIQQIKLSEEWTAKELSFEKAMQGAPAFLETMQKELAKPIIDATPEIDPKWTLTQIEPLLNKAESDLAEAKKNLADLRKEESDRTNRRTDIPNQIAKNQELLKEINARLSNPLPKEGNAELNQAERFLLQAQRKVLEQEIKSIDKELLSYNARGTLLLARIDLASQRLSNKEKNATAWRVIVSKMRQKQAEDDAQKAREESFKAAREHPLLKSLAEYNSQLADKRTGAKGITTAQKKAADDLNQIKKLLETTKNNYEDIQTRLQTAGITHGIGVLLRKQRTEIPDLRLHKGNINSRQSDISDAQLEWFDYKGQRSNLSDIESVVQASLATLTDATEAVRNELTPRIQTILNTRKNYLESLINDYDDYIDTLINLDIAERNLIEQASELKEYIDKHILWIRSASIPGVSDTGDFIKALSWMCDYQGWRTVLGSFWDDYNQNFSAYLFGFFIYILLIYGRFKWAPRINGLSDKVKKKKLLTTFSHTVECLFFTLFTAVFLPLVLVFFAWRLSFYNGVSEYPLSVTSGLYTTAIIFYTLEILRYLCQSKGLGEVHFKWRAETLQIIRRNLIWFMPIFLFIAYTFSIIEWQSIQEHKDTLGRFLFISGMVVISIFNRKAMAGFANIPTNQADGWSFKSLNQRHYLWYPIALYLPIFLALLAFVGYYYTAVQLNWRFISTVWLVFGLIILNSLVQRWILLTHRTIAIQEARRKHAAKQASLEESASGENPPELKFDESELDIAAINEQTKKLIRSFLALGFILGLWFVWVDMLPALDFLDRVELWEIGASAVSTAANEGSDSEIVTITEKSVITLKNLLFALIVLAMTVISTRNVPGVLEMAVLQKMPIDAGTRYAYTTVARYIIAVVGIIFVCGSLGIQWSSIQWLVAAMTLGLGFGLQEIFANFVSGLIILFERPIRIGDTVTVGDVSGTVSKIRIRGTTITNWDRKELIIPNKEFITGQVINWTLSDQVLRLVIPVGIAYGSDVEKAHEVLMNVAVENDNVLDDPSPRVTFESFGDSTLDFALRAFIPSIDVMLKTKDQLNCAIDRDFRKAGIEIAFPQRDIHIRTVEQPLFRADKQENENQ